MRRFATFLLVALFSLGACSVTASAAPRALVHSTIRTTYQIKHPEIYRTASTPVPTNTTVNVVDQTIQNAVYNVAVTAAEAYCVAQLPFLGLPVINSIFNYLMNLGAGYVYNYLSQVAAITIITIQTQADEAVYDASVTQLEQAYATGDSNAISTATSQFKTALATLIHWNS